MEPVAGGFVASRGSPCFMRRHAEPHRTPTPADGHAGRHQGTSREALPYEALGLSMRQKQRFVARVARRDQSEHLGVAHVAAADR